MNSNLLEVFFDYACPYCYKAHQILIECLQLYPDTPIYWRPCESHPRPDTYGPHSDLLIQGYFFAEEQGIPPLLYHKKAYAMIYEEHLNIENPKIVTQYMQDILPMEQFLSHLVQKTYKEKLLAANRVAFQEKGVWVVPAYRYNGKKLDAVENIGVSKKQIFSLLAD